MAEKEIRRTRTADPEMDAIAVISQALAPLDRSACKRVLEWAQRRYVDVDPLVDWDGDSMKSVSNFMGAVAETAARLGMADRTKLLSAMAKVVDQVKLDEAEEKEEEVAAR